MQTESIEIPVSVIDKATTKLKGIRDNILMIGDDAETIAKKQQIAGAVFATTTAIIASSYQAYTKLSESVRDLSLISGESTENTSRFIQVLDDFQLTAEDATTAARFLKEKGLSPNIETLAKLSDQFKNIQDPAKRLEFIQENLGRGGAKWVNVLNQGGEALRKLSGEIDKNLILSEQQIKMYEVQRLAIDNVMDKAEAFKVQLGSAIGNVLAYNQAVQRATEITLEMGGSYNDVANKTQVYKDALNQAIAEQLQAAETSTQYKDSLAEQELALKAAEEAQKSMNDANREFLGLLGNIQSETESYAKQYQDINNDMSLSDDERKKKLQELADEHELQNRRIILGLLERKLTQDGILDDKELQWLLEKGQAWGIYSAEVVTATQAAIAEADRLASTLNGLPTSKTFTYYLTTSGSLGVSNVVSGTGQIQKKYATGGSWIIPSSKYGIEEYKMPDGRTASGGEMITVTPPSEFDKTPKSNMFGNMEFQKQVIGLLQVIANKKEIDNDGIARLVDDRNLMRAR